MIGVSGYYSDLEADGARPGSHPHPGARLGGAKTEDGSSSTANSLTDIDIDTRTVAFLGGSRTPAAATAACGCSQYQLRFEARWARSAGYRAALCRPLVRSGHRTGTLALQINREGVESLQGRIGLDYQNAGGPIRIDANIDFVHEMKTARPSYRSVRRRNRPGSAVPAGQSSKDWGEAGCR